MSNFLYQATDIPNLETEESSHDIVVLCLSDFLHVCKYSVIQNTILRTGPATKRMLICVAKYRATSLTQEDRYAVATVDNSHTISPRPLLASVGCAGTSTKARESAPNTCAQEAWPDLDNGHVIIKELDEPTKPFFSPSQLGSKVVILTHDFRICGSVTETHYKIDNGGNKPDSSTAWLSCSAPRIRLSSSTSGGKLKCSGFFRQNRF